MLSTFKNTSLLLEINKCFRNVNAVTYKKVKLSKRDMSKPVMHKKPTHFLLCFGGLIMSPKNRSLKVYHFEIFKAY